MKIFLPIQIKPTGGSSSFANKLKRGFKAKRHQVTFDFCRDFDILLINASCPLSYLIFAKLKGKPIVQRLDGVYYPMTIVGKKYRLYNFPLQMINMFFANYAIYQSNYSKKCCNKFLGINRYIKNSTIYNGVDTKHFINHGQKKNLRNSEDQHLFITTARFRRKDQIYPLIKSFKLYQNKHFNNSKLIVLGNFEGSVKNLPNKFKHDPSIEFLGAIENIDLPKYLRATDVFLFTHLNPPCPNNIIEAMACGLPICGVNDGAMSELTQKGYNSELIPASNDAFYAFRNFNHILFAKNMSKIMSNHKYYAQNSRTIASNRFTLRQMIDNYLKIFSSLSQTNIF